MILKKVFKRIMKNNAPFGKIMENVKEHRDIQLIKTEIRSNCLVSDPNYHTTKFFAEHLLAIEMTKTQVLMRKPVYLRLSILELSKILMYEFCYNYVKAKYGEKTKLRYMGPDSFIVYIKTDDIYKEIADNVKTKFNTSNYDLNRLLPKGKNKKVIGSMKD